MIFSQSKLLPIIFAGVCFGLNTSAISAVHQSTTSEWLDFNPPETLTENSPALPPVPKATRVPAKAKAQLPVQPPPRHPVHKPSKKILDKPFVFKSGGFLQLGTGIAYPKASQMNSIQVLPLPNPPDLFYPGTVKSTAFFDVSGGYQIGSQQTFLPAYRIEFAYQYAPSTEISGMGQQRSELPWQTYTGRIETQSLFLGASIDVFKIKLGSQQVFTPYLEGGVGASRNSTYNYQLTDPSPEIVFPDHAQMSLAWRVEGGLGYHILISTHELALSLGYRYADKGNVQTGVVYSPCVSTALSSSLKLPIHDNEVLFSMRFVV